MNIRDRGSLKKQASRVLSSTGCDTKKLVIIHSGVTCGVSLLLTLLTFLLQNRMDSAVGLAGLGTRNFLASAQTLMQICSVVVLPIWEVGFLYSHLSMARNQDAGPQSLLEGFRRFGPVFRLMLLQMLIITGLSSLLIYPSAMLFMISPFSNAFMEVLEPMLSEASLISGNIVMDEAMLSAAAGALLPMIFIYLLLFAVIAIPLFYRFRMAEYILMDEPRCGALAAMVGSSQIMRKNRFAMFRLDLSFWWYYLLQGLLMALTYGDVILAALNISLPLSPNAAFFLFYILSMAGQFLLFYAFKNKITQTYTQTYLSLRYPPQSTDLVPGEQISL